jgi:hypothetical protein
MFREGLAFAPNAGVRKKKTYPGKRNGTQKSTASLQLQEFCQRNQIVDSTTSAARLSLPS